MTYIHQREEEMWYFGEMARGKLRAEVDFERELKGDSKIEQNKLESYPFRTGYQEKTLDLIVKTPEWKLKKCSNLIG